MLSSDENAFLPTDNDRIKAQIKELQVRLHAATEKQRQLKRQLIEEDLSYVVVSKITEGIKDPTRTQAHELEGLQKEIFEQLLITAEQCTIREIISYHRLGGKTVFDYNKQYFGIRLETFYNKSYKEPFYLMFLKKNPNRVDKHTIPKYIPLSVLEKKYLPDNLQTFLRTVHDCVQAYVTRKEMMKEIENLSTQHPLDIIYKNGSISRIELEVDPVHTSKLRITILFENYTSCFPSEITIRDAYNDETREEMDELIRSMMNGNMAEALSTLWA